MREPKQPKYKLCPRCGEYKPHEEFWRDRRRPDGLDGWCKHCRAQAGKRRKPTLRPQATHKQCMTGEQFVAFTQTHDWLERYVCRQAARKTRNRELREDLIQEAWIRLSFCPQGMSESTVKAVVNRALSQAYMKAYRARNYDLSYTERMSADEYAMWRSGIYLP